LKENPNYLKTFLVKKMFGFKTPSSNLPIHPIPFLIAVVAENEKKPFKRNRRKGEE
jgi:hypothetical protein